MFEGSEELRPGPRARHASRAAHEPSWPSGPLSHAGRRAGRALGRDPDVRAETPWRSACGLRGAARRGRGGPLGRRGNGVPRRDLRGRGDGRRSSSAAATISSRATRARPPDRRSGRSTSTCRWTRLRPTQGEHGVERRPRCRRVSHSKKRGDCCCLCQDRWRTSSSRTVDGGDRSSQFAVSTCPFGGERRIEAVSRHACDAPVATPSPAPERTASRGLPVTGSRTR